ncbi:hypothetical protein FKG94_03175 [Exilibacterium tricleocarpae]|uniref:Uncharacterized protein n=1 Tax=Exilibacterium tricleocarpae TaxID=2591008 RepID=A0A545U708_9GAMM|nr:hypothetical protein [Exilibacterium tricleocarpae]TQV85269.1 hypothetical protein FKG94_03175 [Exilibacterium tricleocarpae]
MYYGLAKRVHAVEIAKAVCNVLGNGANRNADRLLLETAAQETRLGTYRDLTPYAAGTGLCQVDQIGFDDVLTRTRDVHRYKTIEYFGIDLSLVHYRELELSPLLSFVVCRLFYLLIPDPIPQSLAERAGYWKRHYNTVAGKGSVGEYMRNATLLDDLSESITDD